MKSLGDAKKACRAYGTQVLMASLPGAETLG